MSDSDDTPKVAATPSWQKATASPEPKTVQTDTQDAPEKSTLAQARLFLQDDEVRQSSRERKADFLKTKGISAEDIETLLSEDDKQTAETQRQTVQETRHDEHPPVAQIPPPIEPADANPPVITYPEFLVRPHRPPPLVTVDGFINTLKVFGGLSAVVYGASRYIVEPMVDRLTAARIELHETADTSLSKLVAKLEATVSEVPAPARSGVAAAAKPTYKDQEDSGSEKSAYDDPTELFHRDIGVQTSRPSSPLGYSSLTGVNRADPPPRPNAAERLTDLVTAVRLVKDGYEKEARDYDVTRTMLDEFGRDMSSLAYRSNDYTYGYNGYGGSAANEPDDEIKQAKDNIRRVKGVFLTTRSFPTTVSR